MHAADCDSAIYISVAVLFVLFSLVLGGLALLFWWHRVRVRRRIQLLVGDISNNSYASTNRSESIAQSYRQGRHYSSFSKYYALVLLMEFNQMMCE